MNYHTGGISLKVIQKSFILWVKKEPVLVIAAFCAGVSMFIVPPSAAYMQYIDWKTLVCLFCLMVSIKGLEREGVLNAVSRVALSHLRSTRSLTFFLVFGAFLASMFMTNDVALIALVPIAISVLFMCQQEQWAAYVVVLQTIAANIGSSLTPVGNPQNLYIFSHYNMNLSTFIGTILPYVLAGATCLVVCCFFVKNSSLLPMNELAVQDLSNNRIIIYGVLFILSVMAVFGIIPYFVTAIIVILVALVLDKKLFVTIDFSLLFTFFIIFTFVGNLSNISGVKTLLQQLIGSNVVLASAVSSQFISNVPAAILLSKFTNQSSLLLIGVNIGGMGTLIASMASVISYKLFANVYKKQVNRYFKIFAIYNIGFLLILLALHWLLQTIF